MKTNARKILSLVLSFLMVFGSVATLLPTTVMAAETGATIDCKVFTAYDLYAAVNTEKSLNFSYSMYSDGNGNAYLRAKPQSSTANKNHIALDLGAAIGDYDCIQIEYATNIPASGEKAYMLCYTTNGYSSAQRDHYFEAYNNSSYTSNMITQTNEKDKEWSQWIKLCPWGGTKALTNYVDTDAATEKPTIAEAYYDIKYIAFFKNREAALNFNYNDYIDNDVQITINGVAVDVEFGAVVDLVQLSGLPYANEDGGFLVFTSSGNVITNPSSYVAAPDEVITSDYYNVTIVEPNDFADTNDFSLLNFKRGEGAEIQADGSYRMIATTTTPVIRCTNLNIDGIEAVRLVYDLSWERGEGPKLSLRAAPDGTEQNSQKTAYSGGGGKSSFGDYPQDLTFDISSYTTGVANGTYSGINVYPWGTLWGLDATSRDEDLAANKFYVDLHYFALFSDGTVSAAFDYDAYKDSIENDKYVTLVDAEGNPLGTVKGLEGAVVDLSTVANIPYKDADGKFLTWTDGTNVYGDTYTITGKTNLIARYIDFKLYLPEDLVDCYSRYKNIVDPPTIYEGYYRLKNIAAGSNYVGWTFDVEAGYSEAAVEYVTNAYSKNGVTAGASFVRKNQGSTIHYKYQSSIPETITDGSVTENVKAIYPLSADVTYNDFDFAPWNGAQFTSTIGVNDDNRTKAYADVKYVAFFENTGDAALFEYEKYCGVTVTVMIDGVKNDALSGKYVPGSSIKLPANDDPLFVGYVQNGKLVTTATAAEGTISVTTLYRNNVKGNYVNERGNLANFKAAALDGEVTVVYLGGSVTVGQGASHSSKNWANLTTKNLEAAGLTVKAYNEGIGGTGSVLGAYRVAGDVIAHNPDLVFVDFTLNDAYWNSDTGVKDNMYYEYVIRSIREALPNTEIISLYIADTGTVQANGFDMYTLANEHDAIAAAYDVTSIYLAGYAAEAMFGTEDKFDANIWKIYVPDGVHPGDLGYELYAEAIAGYLAGAFETDAADAAEYELPEALYERVLTFVPQTIALDSVTTTGMTFTEGATWSTFFNKELRPTNYADEAQTVTFTFEGTELYLYMSSPNKDAQISVTVDGETFTRTGDNMMSNGPKLFFKGLDNKTHTVTVKQTGATKNGYIMGILAGTEIDNRPEYTINLTASIGGQVKYDGVTDDSFVITAKEGDKLVFTAVPEEGNYLRAWHDLTSGQLIVLSDEAEYEYTVTKNALINANFVPDDIKAPARLVAFVDRTFEGTIDGLTYVDEYVSASEETTLNAVANEGYVAAYWKRLAQDSEVEVFVTAGAEAEVYALGGYVFYQPVFLEEGETVDLYISATTNEILSVDAAPAGYTSEKNLAASTEVVDVYVCTKTEAEVSDYQLEVYALGATDPVVSEENPAYGSEWIITTSKTNTKWMMSINGGEEFVVSYEQEYHFNYMFDADTKVVITEAELGEGEEAGVIVKTVASWNNEDNSRLYFSGLFELTDGLTLVNHGVMMSKNKADLTSLTGNATGDIEVVDGTIIGRISDNSANATANFAVIKGLADASDVWYGRAFLVYTDGTTTYLVYADETIPTI